MYIKIAKTRDVKAPERANWGDALDFYIPEDFPETRLFANENVVIPAGIKVEVPFGYGLVFMNKSGIASKQELIIGACLVDHGYSGEVHIDLHNIGRDAKLLKPGMKVAQAVIIPLQVPSVIEVAEEELYNNVANLSDRGAGGFGSTGV